MHFCTQDDPEDKRSIAVSLTAEQNKWFEERLEAVAVDEKDPDLVSFLFKDGSSGPWIGRTWPALTFSRVVGVPWEEARRR